MTTAILPKKRPHIGLARTQKKQQLLTLITTGASANTRRSMKLNTSVTGQDSGYWSSAAKASRDVQSYGTNGTEMIRILKGDCREVLRTLPDESVHCVVT